jgi:hypothetical protein
MSNTTRTVEIGPVDVACPAGKVAWARRVVAAGVRAGGTIQAPEMVGLVDDPRHHTAMHWHDVLALGGCSVAA